MNFLFKWITLCLAFGVGCAANATDSTQLTKQLHNASDASSLDDVAMKPWHLKMDVQLYDEKGGPAEKGTLEEWWTRGKEMRVYDTPSYKTTEIRTYDVIYRAKGQTAVPYLLNAIRAEAVHPMPRDEFIEAAKPVLKVQSFGSVKLDCIVLSPELKNVAHPSPGLSSEYCLAQSEDLLRASNRYASESANLNSIGAFQGRKVSFDPSISVHQVKAVSGHITALQTIDLDPSFFAISEKMAAHGDFSMRPKSAENAPISKVAPAYPQEAREKHILGTVRLAASIGTDGYVQSLAVIDSPDPSLTDSALRAVRKWIYKPYLLNGVPLEVDTIISINFNSGDR